MKIADILRVIANNLEHSEGGAPDPRIQNPAGLIDASGKITKDPAHESPNGTTPSGNDKAPEIFLPPLQQKQELLKKAVGVENVYDDGAPADRVETESESEAQEDQAKDDIVSRIRELGGVPTAAIQELANDEIFDD
jgi:hypothetical protein